MKPILHSIRNILFVMYLFTTAVNLRAQATAFTYQGRLHSGGAPANGTYDLVFTIYDLPTGPGAFANQTNSAVAISNGLFAVALDFGPGIFTGPERWLEIAVRTNGGGSFSNLVPRQKITATPYAITASNLSGTISAGQLSGPIPLAQLPAAVVTNNQSGVNISGTFNGNGGSLTNLNSENLAGPLTLAEGAVSLGHINDGGYAAGVAVSGNFAYLANADDGLRVHDIANPTNPVGIGHINDGGQAVSVAVSGNFAYLANYDDGLRICNIANPTNPVSIGHINDGGQAVGVAVSGNFAYLANADDGLRIYNIANPANPVSIGHINDGGLAVGVAMSGNFAYLANYGDGLRVYNIANPTNPVSVGHIDDGGSAAGVAVSGNLACLANYGDGLRVYNIANPTNPVSIGHINDGGLAVGVAVSGNFAYLANYHDGLRIYNIANPTNPVGIGYINDGGQAVAVAVSGNFAYLANAYEGLRVYGLRVASALGFRGNGSLLTGLNADNITSGTLNPARIPNLDASKITGGIFAAAQIPNLDASKITGGTLVDGRLSANVALRAGGNAFTGNQTVASGSVGIGTLTPASSLQVNGGIRARGGPPGPDGNANNGYTFGTPGDDDSGLSSSANGQLEFYSNSAEVMRIASGGNVGIGVTAPQQQLSVATGMNIDQNDSNSGTVANTLRFGSGSGEAIGSKRNPGGNRWGLDFYTDSINRMTILNTGNVGIGTVAPVSALQVIGTVTATAFNPPSDRNLKENFAPVSPRDMLDKVAAMPISRWNFKGDIATSHVGPMAQDFHAAFGLGTDDKHIATVDADGVALAAIQGLNEKVESGKQKAETRIQKLEAENAELKARLSALEKIIAKTHSKGN